MLPSKLPIYQVDAFTSHLFKGNPAAVCPLDSWLPDELMQNIAAENNLSETAFFVQKGAYHELRWFTPAVEVALCGHATLATAHVLYEHLGYAEDEIRFETRHSVILRVRKEGEGLCMDFPVDPLVKTEAPPGLNRALGTNLLECFKGKTDYLVVLNTQEDVDFLKPDFSELAKIDARGIIVSAPGQEHDFISRFFGPAAGVDEDPVTGSAHTTLVPYWAKRLNKNILTAQQRSKRTGEIKCELQNDRVLLTGSARTYLIGRINIL